MIADWVSNYFPFLSLNRLIAEEERNTAKENEAIANKKLLEERNRLRFVLFFYFFFSRFFVFNFVPPFLTTFFLSFFFSFLFPPFLFFYLLSLFFYLLSGI